MTVACVTWPQDLSQVDALLISLYETMPEAGRMTWCVNAAVHRKHSDVSTCLALCHLVMIAAWVQVQAGAAHKGLCV